MKHLTKIKTFKITQHGEIILFLICLLSMLLTLPSPALAHKVSVFAWVEGDTVHTQSKFFGGKKLNDARVNVFDAAGNLLLEGRTDAGGEFSFTAPERAEMKIVVSAGMGHQADWTVRATDFAGLTEASSSTEANASQSSSQFTLAQNSGSQTHTPAFTPDSKEIQIIFEKALDKKLTPVIKMLSEAREQRPGMRDILGGIGYIVGLVGLAAYFSSRKKKDALKQ